MKVTTLMEVLLICVLIAFASSKSVKPNARNASAIIVKTDNVTEASVIMREATVDPTSVQVVPDLVDSMEVSSNAISQGDSNEVLDTVIEDSVAVKPAAEKPSTVADEVAGAATNEVDKPVNNDDPNPINKYCVCSEAQCKCCRDFSIPLIPVRGPGCATIRYLDNDKLGVTIKYGDFVLASRQIDSKRTTPICVPLPGGFNRFCGRVYGISRENENFKACLGLELRADDEVEASLRVSCFQFGPRGLATMEAEPLPALESTEDDDDDDDDFLGLGGIGDDDDDDDDDDEDDEAPAPSGAAGLISTVLSGLGAGGGGGDDDDDGFAGFSLLGSASDFIGGLFGSDSNNKKKPAEGITINRRNDVKEKKKKNNDLKKKSSISKMDEDVLESEETTTELLDKLTDYTETKGEEAEDDSSDDGILSVVAAAIDELSEDETEKNPAKKDVEKTEPSKENEAVDKEEDDDDDDNDDDDDYDDYEDEEPKKKPNSNAVTDVKADQKIAKKKKVKSGYGLGFLGRFFNFFNYK